MSNYIRFASPEDALNILEIYAPFVITTPVTFEVDVPRPYDFRRRIQSISSSFPYLVCEIDGVVAGFAYAHAQKGYAAYAWNAELTVYIRNGYQRCNIASALYMCLIRTLREQGFRNAVALITSSNESSEHFHAAFGFRKVGVLEKVGYKLGTWHDVSIYEKNLGDDADSKPHSTKSVHEIDRAFFDKLFAASSKIIKVSRAAEVG